MGSRRSATSTPPARRVHSTSASLPPRSALTRPATAQVLTPRLAVPDHDIRRKRPPALSFLLRMSTMRRVARVLSLLALDFAGLAFAIFTALLLKEVVLGRAQASTAAHGTEQFLPFAYL